MNQSIRSANGSTYGSMPGRATLLIDEPGPGGALRFAHVHRTPPPSRRCRPTGGALLISPHTRDAFLTVGFSLVEVGVVRSG